MTPINQLLHDLVDIQNPSHQAVHFLVEAFKPRQNPGALQGGAKRTREGLLLSSRRLRPDMEPLRSTLGRHSSQEAHLPPSMCRSLPCPKSYFYPTANCWFLALLEQRTSRIPGDDPLVCWSVRETGKLVSHKAQRGYASRHHYGEQKQPSPFASLQGFHPQRHDAHLGGGPSHQKTLNSRSEGGATALPRGHPPPSLSSSVDRIWSTVLPSPDAAADKSCNRECWLSVACSLDHHALHSPCAQPVQTDPVFHLPASSTPKHLPLPRPSCSQGMLPDSTPGCSRETAPPPHLCCTTSTSSSFWGTSIRLSHCSFSSAQTSQAWTSLNRR